jgi:hypothetical protein
MHVPIISCQTERHKDQQSQARHTVCQKAKLKSHTLSRQHQHGKCHPYLLYVSHMRSTPIQWQQTTNKRASQRAQVPVLGVAVLWDNEIDLTRTPYSVNRLVPLDAETNSCRPGRAGHGPPVNTGAPQDNWAHTRALLRVVGALHSPLTRFTCHVSLI